MSDEIEDKVVTSTRHSVLKETFLRLVSQDLRSFGLGARTVRRGSLLSFHFSLGEISTSCRLEAIKREQIRRVSAESGFINRMRAGGVTQLFIDETRLNVNAIEPVIHFCRSPEEFALFRYCRMLQSVPAPKLLYRQIAALVRDHGQPGAPLMGIFGLSSPVYSMRCRDRALGWSDTARKENGLKSSMQLNICMAVPPYSSLRGAKLIAAIAASTSSAAEFERRYGNRTTHLETIVTTTATGIHSPIFNRIMLRRGGLYRRIGETTGYSSIVFSRETMHSAVALVRKHDRQNAPDTDRSIRLLKRALNLCCVPRERIVRLGVVKGIYLARAQSKGDWPSLGEILEYWKVRELPKATAKLARVTIQTSIDNCQHTARQD